MMEELKKDVKDQPTQNRIEQLIKSNAELNKPATPIVAPKTPIAEPRRAPVRTDQLEALEAILKNYCSDSMQQKKAYEAITLIFPES